MSKGDVAFVGGGNLPTVVFDVEDRTTSSASATIKAGEPVKMCSALGGYPSFPNVVIILATGEPNVTSSTQFVGIASEDSDETSTVDGYCGVHMAVPFVTQMRCKATTVANIDTAAKLKAYMGHAVSFDLTTGIFTVDEDETDDPNDHGLVIVGGDTEKGTLDFFVKPLVTLLGNNY